MCKIANSGDLAKRRVAVVAYINFFEKLSNWMYERWRL